MISMVKLKDNFININMIMISIHMDISWIYHDIIWYHGIQSKDLIMELDL